MNDSMIFLEKLQKFFNVKNKYLGINFILGSGAE